MTEQEINELNEKLCVPVQSVRVGSFLWRRIGGPAGNNVKLWVGSRHVDSTTTFYVRRPAPEANFEVTMHTPLGSYEYETPLSSIARCAIEAERELLAKLAATLDMFCSGASGLLNLVLGRMSDCDAPADGSFAQRAGCIATDYARRVRQMPGAGNMPFDWPGSHEAWEQAQTKPAQARLIAAAAMLVLEADRISQNNTDEQSPTE